MDKYSVIAARILAVLQKHPEGLDIAQIRDLLKPIGIQQHLDRRLRELDPHFVIERERRGNSVFYKYVRPRREGSWDFEQISKNLRAKVLLKASGRCQLCGRTVIEDKARLHIDHKIPREWGGETEEQNLWALCSICNEGKKNYYATLDASVMKGVLSHESVHTRIAELLRAHKGGWVDCDMIEFVANVTEYQTDWRKRLRELRYLGLQIKTKRQMVGRRYVSYYRLSKDVPLPDDPSRAAREYEAARTRRKSSHGTNAK